MDSISCDLLHRNYDISLHNGQFSHCCRFKGISVSPSELNNLGYRYFNENSETLRARSDLANGIQTPRCQDCWDNEGKNLPSWRLIKSNRIKDNELYLNIQLSSLCNQSCFYCLPESSSTIAKYGSWIHTSTAEVRNTTKSNYIPASISFQTVIDFVKNLDQSVEQLNLSISGGEPFLLEDFEDNMVELAKVFLSTNDARQVSIVISTNTNTKPGKVMDFYDKFNQLNLKHRITFGIVSSLENIEERAEYVRDGLIWSNFEENFKIHHSMADASSIRLTMNPFSVVKITEFFKYFMGYSNVKFNYNYPFQNFLRMEVLDNRFNYELERLNQYITAEDVGHRFEKQFYKFLPDMIKDDKDNARLFKRAITNIDTIKHKNWRTVFPEYIEWFDAIE
jgi:organic radical activating enzyme